MEYTLGLDLGVASLGWAVVVEPTTDQDEDSFLHLGVHRFEAGVADPGKMGFGKEESSAKPRRDARQMRRQIWRRKRRRKLLLHRLQEHGLLPEGEINTPDAVHAYLRQIDEAIESRRFSNASHEDRLKLPYLLRSIAVRERVELDELGRLLSHLAHRRGFLSNRKTDKEDDKDATEFKKDMAELQEQVNRHDPPYVGAYLASLNPDEQRLRARRTSRQMYLDEFEAIWAEQSKHHPTLTDEQIKHSIWKAIFYQRPLKSQRHLRGTCSLTGKTRAAVALRCVQRLRALQKLNDLLIIFSDGTKRKLTDDEREKVYHLQMTEGDVTFAKLKTKKVLGLPKDATFNLAEIEKKLIGHRTDAKLRKVLGETFDTLTEAQRDGIVTELRSFRDTDALTRRLQTAYDLDETTARNLAKVKLEPDRAAHSRQAIDALLPLLEKGVQYATARKTLFPESFENNTDARDLLPSLEAWLKQDQQAAAIRNPAIMRGLTEVRKVVNAIIRRYGKPKTIRLEIARDLKNSRKRRGEISKENNDRRTTREKAAKLLLDDYGIDHPRHGDIEKVLLHWECGGICPYTDKPIEMNDLFGPNPTFQVEHIWPLSASMDDSYLNKTLCHVDENVRKGGRAPIDCYDDEQLDAIKQRIGRFHCDYRAKQAKLRRFSEPVPDGFSSRHLNDTRYLATEAGKYLGCLYNDAVPDGPTPLRVFVVTGGLTAMMRGLWGLNTLAGGPANEKERIDHRHHAIDALVVALTRQAHTQKLSAAAARAERQHLHRAFVDVADPWVDFFKQAKEAIDKIVVSYRPDHRLRGKLHQDSMYSPEVHGSRRIRRELFGDNQLKASEVDKIIDPRIAHAIRDKLKELNQTEPAKAFSNPANLPFITDKDGQAITDKNGRATRIRKTRIKVTAKPSPIGKAASQRHVNLGSNHHTVITKDERGRWSETTVSLIEAVRRKADGEPVIQTPMGQTFLYSLTQNDHVEINDEERGGLWRVNSIGQNDVELVEQCDGRTDAQRKQEKDRFRLRSSTSWTKLKPRKVHVTHLGEVKDAGG